MQHAAWEQRFQQVDLGALWGLLVLILVTSLFIYAAARLTGEDAGFGSAVATALVGSLLYALTLFLLPNRLGIVLGIIVWAGVAASFHRTRWIKGLLIGIVAWILSLITLWLISLL